MAARLEYEITGSVSGLASAASQATGILNNLQNTANQLNIKLFSAETVGDINGIGGALTTVNNKIQEYLNNAIKGSQAFKDQQSQTALDNLANKISVLTGNVSLFGQTVKNSQQQINAYQSAINSLLSSGLSPFDDKIVALKKNIDSLTSSIEQQKAASQTIADPYSKFRATGGLITDLENRIRNLTTALKGATNTRDITQYNLRIKELKDQLASLNSRGLTGVVQSNLAVGRSAISAGVGINSFNLELGRIVQDAPFAANNFGAIGNNITRAFEVLPQYRDRLREVIVAQGGTATSGAVLREGLKGLFTGFSGISLALSLAISAFTIYQQVQQKNARQAQERVNLIEKEKQALEAYINTLSASQRVQAAGAENYAKDIVQLDSLYNALLRNTNARIGNNLALEQLQAKWPEEFANLQKGVGFVDQLSEAYQKLKDLLIETGKAEAAKSLSASANITLVKNTVALGAATSDLAIKEDIYQKILAKRKGVLAKSLSGQNLSGEEVSIISGLADQADRIQGVKKAIEVYSAAISKAKSDINAFNAAAQNSQEKINADTAAKSRIKYLEDQISLTGKLRDALGTEAGLNAADNAKRLQYNATIKADEEELARLRGKEKVERVGTIKSLQQELSIRQQIANILAKGLNAANASGLSDYGAEVQKITSLYGDLNRQLDQVAAKLKVQQDVFAKTGGKRGISPATAATDRSAISTGRNALGLEQQKQLNDARIAEEKRVVSEVQRINDEYGVKAQESRNKELAAVDARANAEISAAKSKTRTLIAITNDYISRLQQAGNSPKAIAAATAVFDAEVQAAKDSNMVVLAIQNGRVVAKGAIDDKYLLKEKQLQDNIVGLNESALAELNDKQGQRTDRIVAEWEKRKVAASKYFDELRKIAPERADQFNQQQTQLNNLFDAVKFRKVSEEISKNFATAMQQGVNAFAQNFYTAITTLGEQRSAIDLKYDLQLEQAGDESTRNQINRLRQLEQQTTTSFTAIFSKLTQSLTETFNKSIFDGFVKKITENLGATLLSPGKGNSTSGVVGSIQSAADKFNFQTTGAATALSTALTFAGVGFSSSVDESGKSLSENVGNAGSQLSKGVATALAGLSLAGGLVSGLTPKTSTIGQGLGGALSGAGSGALIGSAIPGIGTVIGGAIGGIVGALGGIFGASKAKKQEELQKAQLEEQKKQTSLLQQTLAYTSTVIGRVTAEGTLSQISIDAYGKLVATLSGKDIQLALDRTAKTRI